eukprot:365594-Chlamydomonas_euryale.AAC.6
MAIHEEMQDCLPHSLLSSPPSHLQSLVPRRSFTPHRYLFQFRFLPCPGHLIGYGYSHMCALLRWLIAIAYFLAGGFIKSGLGNRIAYAIVSAFGKTTLGLTYSLVMAEALLSPAIPSVAARAGGIFFPLAKVGVGFRAWA